MKYKKHTKVIKRRDLQTSILILLTILQDSLLRCADPVREG